MFVSLCFDNDEFLPRSVDPLVTMSPRSMPGPEIPQHFTCNAGVCSHVPSLVLFLLSFLQTGARFVSAYYSRVCLPIVPRFCVVAVVLLLVEELLCCMQDDPQPVMRCVSGRCRGRRLGWARRPASGTFFQKGSTNNTNVLG